MKEPLERSIVNAIQTAIAEFHGRGSIEAFSIARSVVSSEPELVDKWALAKIAQLAQQQISALTAHRPEPEYSMLLPGFSSLSDPLPLPDGAIPLGDATIRDLRNSRSLIPHQERELARERAEARIASLDKIIASMSPFARKRRGLTVAQWCAMAAASGEAVAQARWGKGK